MLKGSTKTEWYDKAIRKRYRSIPSKSVQEEIYFDKMIDLHLPCNGLLGTGTVILNNERFD